ncbi:hypothetical protein [Streptomyces sp. NRRL B-1347]|uniref:hypothetical protein n=1 Tax=Streptomyces sp. NRRL B-1347 TaxID=1476877 RepID=UPI0004C5B771|nr:hypothetical protein [Streptomyces sp. NRRL B-1347]
MTHTSTEPVTGPPADDRGILPPYSGEHVDCIKCSNSGAFTFYRASTRALIDDWNGIQVRRGPLPERLERHCMCCGFQWDEALVTGKPGMTPGALAHALDNCTPYPVDLDHEVLDRMATRLLTMVAVTARPDHPLWQYDAGKPTAPVRPQPAHEASNTTEDNPR